jgi:predicted HTH transcriptional regulator
MIESWSSNFESHRLEFKSKYDKNNDEFRRDIVAFANAEAISLLFYGVQNSPRKILGLDKSDEEMDKLQNEMCQILENQIDPPLLILPQIQPLKLQSGKFIMIVKIFPYLDGIYGIRLGNVGNSYNQYEFWERSSKGKTRMDHIRV